MDLKAYNNGRTKSSVYTSKPSNRQTGRGQESHERRDQKGRIQLHARPKNTNREIHYTRPTELAQRRNETSRKSTTQEPYRSAFGKLCNKWRLTFNEHRITVPSELRKKLLVTLHFGHAGATKMLTEAKITWWPNMSKEIKDKTKNCVA